VERRLKLKNEKFKNETRKKLKMNFFLDVNLYKNLPMGVSFCVLIGLSGALILALSLYKLYFFVKVQKPQANPAQLSLFLFSILGISKIIKNQVKKKTFYFCF
jgi:hypothetical protein